MGLTTFASARKWVEPGFGDCQPDVTAEVVNAIRAHFFNWYDEIALFLDAIECFWVKRYCLDCNDCRNSYRGITLPRECQNIEAIWFNDSPVRIHDSWREYQQGISSECDCRIKALEVPGSFCTFEDITPGAAVNLIVVALDASDAGKWVTLRGISAGNMPITENIQLATEPRRTTEAFRSIDPRGGVVKEVTNGRVVLMAKGGTVYGRYEPDETVPSYRRQKITGLGDDVAIVNVRSARQFFPLSGDLDVVETDNRMAFDAMARYLREYRKTEKTQASLLAEKDHLATARKLIIGGKARDTGRATQVDVQIATPSFFGRGLNRFG